MRRNSVPDLPEFVRGLPDAPPQLPVFMTNPSRPCWMAGLPEVSLDRWDSPRESLLHRLRLIFGIFEGAKQFHFELQRRLKAGEWYHGLCWSKDDRCLAPASQLSKKGEALPVVLLGSQAFTLDGHSRVSPGQLLWACAGPNADGDLVCGEVEARHLLHRGVSVSSDGVEWFIPGGPRDLTPFGQRTVFPEGVFVDKYGLSRVMGPQGPIAKIHVRKQLFYLDDGAWKSGPAFGPRRAAWVFGGSRKNIEKLNLHAERERLGPWRLEHGLRGFLRDRLVVAGVV